MYQLFRVDFVNNKKIKVGDMNESRDFLLECVRKEYLSIDFVIDEEGNWNVTGWAYDKHKRRVAEVWTIEPIRLFTS